MKEAKSPKRSLLYYYGIVLIVLLLFNMIVSPMLMQRQVVDTDYGTFMRMIEDGTITADMVLEGKTEGFKAEGIEIMVTLNDGKFTQVSW